MEWFLLRKCFEFVGYKYEPHSSVEYLCCPNPRYHVYIVPKDIMLISAIFLN